MDFSLFRAGHKVQRGASRWMLYFMAMLGSASGQETLLDYWFLWGDDRAAIPGGEASRVIRVEGLRVSIMFRCMKICTATPWWHRPGQVSTPGCARRHSSFPASTGMPE